MIKVVFNAGQWALACGLGGLVFTALNGSTLIQGGVAPRDLLVPFGGFAIIFVTVTHAAVAGVISLSGEVGLRKVWRNVIGESGGNVFFDLLISPVAFGIALLYIPLHTTGLLIAFLPLFFIRHSYYINLRLQKANKDLLTALVKALETRDPYTSGHSLRVASLARDIAGNFRTFEASDCRGRDSRPPSRYRQDRRNIRRDYSEAIGSFGDGASRN